MIRSIFATERANCAVFLFAAALLVACGGDEDGNNDNDADTTIGDTGGDTAVDVVDEDVAIDAEVDAVDPDAGGDAESDVASDPDAVSDPAVDVETDPVSDPDVDDDPNPDTEQDVEPDVEPDAACVDQCVLDSETCSDIGRLSPCVVGSDGCTEWDRGDWCHGNPGSQCQYGTCEPICERTSNVTAGEPGVDDDGDGFSENEGDCDDVRNDVFPNAPEIFDGVDNDCDDRIDDNIDDDCDGYLARGDGGEDCDIYDYFVSPDWPDNGGTDNNCDGVIGDLESGDEDGDGYAAFGSDGTTVVDCDDSDGLAYPGAPEAPGGTVDYNCDGEIADTTDTFGVFVTPLGDDAAAGTAEAPFLTIARGLEAAASRGLPNVFVAQGTYMGRIAVNGPSVYGSFDADTWSHIDGPASTVVGVDDDDSSPVVAIYGGSVVSDISVTRPGFDAVEINDGTFANGDIEGESNVRTGGTPFYVNVTARGNFDINGGTEVQFVNCDIYASLEISQIATATISGSVLYGDIALSQNGQATLVGNVVVGSTGGRTGGLVNYINNIVVGQLGTNEGARFNVHGNLLVEGSGQVGGQTEAAAINDCSFTGCNSASGNLVGDPMFVSVDDYHITTGSDAIDAGVNPLDHGSLGAVADRDGDLRDPEAYDIGMDAFVE